MTDTGAGTPHVCANHDESLDDAYRKGFADARSRPATDPAGLDAAVREFNAFLWSYDEDDHPHASNELKRRWLVVAAGLSVADGPGPEERLREALERERDRPWTSIHTTAARALFDKAKASRTQEVTNTAQQLSVLLPAIESEAVFAVLNEVLRPLPVHREETGRS